jgi:hypothetical protein
MTPPKFITVLAPGLNGRWSVGRLNSPEDGTWWVEILRTNLRYDDAADLRDAWEARGVEARP